MNCFARRLLPVAAALALLAAACGDDTAATPPGTTPPPTTGPATTAPDTTGPTTTEAPDPLAAIGIDLDDCPSGYDPDRGVTDEEILVGHSAPKSGPSAAFSLLTTGMRAYLDYANAELGGVSGRRIVLRDLDDAYDPARTSRNVEQLLADGVFVTSGILGTDNNLAVRDLLNEACVPHLFPSTGAPEWGDVQGYPWTVSGAVIPYNLEARIWADHLQRELPDGGTIALLVMNNDFGRTYEDWFRPMLEGTGLRIVEVQRHEPVAPDIRNQMTTLAASRADVAIAMTTSTFCTQFMKAFEGSAWQPLRIVSGTCKSGVFFAGGDDGAVGTLVASANTEIADPRHGEDPELAAIRARIEQYAPGAPVGISLVPIGWLFGEILHDILVRAEELPGGLTRPNVMLAARSLDLTTPLLHDGIRLRLDGMDDPFIVEAARLDVWNGTGFDPVTEIFDYEATTPVTR